MTTDTRTQRFRTPGRAARAAVGLTAMTVLLAAPLSASAATGGRITFAGAVVAPQLQISAASAIPATGQGTSTARTEHSVNVTFSATPGVVSGADVVLQTNGSAHQRDAIATRFVDGGGRVGAAHDGHYQVGRNGGVLSVSPVRADTDTQVIVVVSYD